MADLRDVIIVGAGPAGSALAYFLAQQGVDVLLLDKTEFPRDKTCGDGLTPRALGVLRRLGLLNEVIRSGFRINGLHIYAPNGRRVSSPIRAWGDLPPFAAVLQRYRLDDLIRQHALGAGAEFRAPVTVTDVIRDGDHIVGVRVAAPGGSAELRARCIVIATGASIGLLERAQLLSSPVVFGRAARGYYDGMRGLSDYIEFHLESVPLPGYGWVFPTSPTAANVGAGYLTENGHTPRNSPRQVFDEFVANPRLAERLEVAQADGPVKGYPLRFDFPTARVAFPGLLLVGEAAGLVNPLTGEGIDYALESAEVGAELLAHALRSGEAAAHTAQRYTRLLRDRFLRTFITIGRVRDFYFRPWLLNRAAGAAARHEDFRATLVHVCLGNVDPGQSLTPRMLWQLVLS